MPKWTKPSEGLEEVEVGDRVIVIVDEVEKPTKRVGFSRCDKLVFRHTLRIVVLVATETGWDSPDPDYVGYTPADGVLWTTEKSLCGIVAAMKATGEL